MNMNGVHGATAMDSWTLASKWWYPTASDI